MSVERPPTKAWNSWNTFGCHIDEDIVLGQGNALAEAGLVANYPILVIDDCWMNPIRVDGRLLPDPKKFRSPIPDLVVKLNAIGLALGLYTSIGEKTCEQLPASFGHFEDDADTFASWGISFLKVDTCGLTLRQYFFPRPPYKHFSHLIKSVSSSSITFNVCNWGFHAPWTWGDDSMDSWRVTMDIFPVWWRVLQIVDFSEPLHEHVKPGKYNDWDMLECGVNGTLFNWAWTPALRPLSPTECKSHFHIWAFALSPLVLGMDVERTPRVYLDIVSDENVLDLHDDIFAPGRRVSEQISGLIFAPSVIFKGKILGLLGFADLPTICLPFSECSYKEYWAKPMEDGSLAVLFFNRGGTLNNAQGFAETEDLVLPLDKIGYEAVDNECTALTIKKSISGRFLFNTLDGSVKAESVPTKGTAVAILAGENGCKFAFTQPLQRYKCDSNLALLLVVIVCLWLLRRQKNLKEKTS